MIVLQNQAFCRHFLEQVTNKIQQGIRYIYANILCARNIYREIKLYHQFDGIVMYLPNIPSVGLEDTIKGHP